MQRKSQFVLEKVPDDGYQSQQAKPVVADYEEIVHIAAVVSFAQRALDEIVQLGKVDVAEQLRSQVADRQPAPFRRVKQAFRGRQPFPLAASTPDVTVVRRIVENDFARQVADQTVVEQLLPRLAVPGRSSREARERVHKHPVELPPVDIHEIAPNVELEHVALPAKVVRARADVPLQPPDAVKGPHALAAGVAVGDKGALEHRRYIVEQQVMHYPVAEVGGENLALDRDVGNEAHAAPHPIASLVDLAVELDEILLEVHFEAELAISVPLVAPGIVIGGENVRQQFFVGHVG